MAAEEENKRHCLANDNGSCSDESLDPRILRIAEAIGRQLEAIVVRRIFWEFAVGKSPRAVATDLNRDGIPGPFGRTWGDTTIRGHACRGNGVVNNELYAGVLVWNRQRFIKDPNSGKRVSRPNPEDKCINTEVPGLR